MGNIYDAGRSLLSPRKAKVESQGKNKGAKSRVQRGWAALLRQQRHLFNCRAAQLVRVLKLQLEGRKWLVVQRKHLLKLSAVAAAAGL